MAVLSMVAVILSAVIFLHPDIRGLLVQSVDPNQEPMDYVRNFYMWSRSHPDGENQIKLGSDLSLQLLHFTPKQTYIIIHGFLGSGKDQWILRLKDALLKRESCNVISVNWSAGSVSAEYYLINPRVAGVGRDVARLVRFLAGAGAGAGAGMSLDLIHVIGHSLGAHAAGHVGKNLNGQLKRITGLDPAGHMFHNADNTSRLDKSDAVFVDVIHTHGCTSILNQWGDCYGIDENIGDADFWPNGGESQPACKEGGDGGESVKDGSSCDHGMAYVLYTESIHYPPTTTYYLARPCDTWGGYNSGWCPCGDSSQYMGYNVVPGITGTFYLNTSVTTPYAMMDPQCSPAAYTLLQIIGVVVLALTCVCTLVCVVVWAGRGSVGTRVYVWAARRMYTHTHTDTHTESTNILTATETNVVVS